MRIKFKKIEEIDLNKMFPIIKANEYELLSGQELVISDKDYTAMKNKKFLSMNGFDIPIDAITVEEISISDQQSEVQEIVDKKFIFSDNVVDVLLAGLESEKNVLLWGKGGHGKSEITEEVFQGLYDIGAIKSLPFVQAFGDGLTEEKLFGGMDIQMYKQQGKIHYLPENSFMNHEIVIFEEIFDAPASVLLSLKDIMTSKKFRQGNEIFNVKTKVFIGLTNKSKKEFSSEDESLKALAERFVLTLNVEWSSYSKTNFLKLFQKVLGDKYYETNKNKLSTLANIIDMNNAQGSTFVSPRTAVAAAQLYCKDKSLAYISEIDPDILAKHDKILREEEMNPLHTELLKKIDDYIDTNDLELLGQSEDFLNELNEIEIETGGMPLDISSITKPSREIKELKRNKTKFMLELINRVSPTGQMMPKFESTKKRLNEIIVSLDGQINK